MIDIVMGTKFRTKRAEKAVEDYLSKSTHPDTRFIFVCDIDDDKTVELGHKLQNKYKNKLKLLINDPPPEGSVVAFNNGTKLVDQKYVIWLADDNCIEPKGWDNLAIKLLEENPEYACLSLRCTVNDNYILPFVNAEYGHTFVFRTDKFRELGMFNPIYKSHYSDPDFFLHMICSGEPIMVSKDIMFEHFVVHDNLFAHNNEVAPPGVDSQTFWAKWNPRSQEVIDCYEKIKDKWGILV